MEKSEIGARRSSCVCKLEGRFVVEHEVVMRTRDKKRKKERRIINKARDPGALTQQRVSSERGSEGILTLIPRLRVAAGSAIGVILTTESGVAESTVSCSNPGSMLSSVVTHGALIKPSEPRRMKAS